MPSAGDGILLHEVPEELRTERVCEAAVSSNYLALEYVPKHLKTDRLCGMALERDPLAIRFFNPEQLTPEVCNRRWPVPTTCVSSAISPSRRYT